MDSQVNDKLTFLYECNHKQCYGCSNGCPCVNSSNHVFDLNDQTTLISDCTFKIKKYNLHCSFGHTRKIIAKAPSSHPWITFIHITCSAVLAFLAVWLTFNNSIFEKKVIRKEMEDIIWRLFHSEQHTFPRTLSSISSTTVLPPSKDKCEPLYVLVYAHCGVWFLFLVLDHVVRHFHHETLRSRGYLRAFARLSRLAAIPFQLVSLWTVLLAIFIAVYAQQDEADLQLYCDKNMLMSPKNGIAVLLIIEFIFVTIFSLLYAYSIRKFCLEKSTPDVCGWEESNYCNRWTPQILQSNEVTINSVPNSEGFLNNEQLPTGQCLLDLLEYYKHTNRELSAKLEGTSQKLHQLEIKNQSPKPSNLNNIESQSCS